MVATPEKAMKFPVSTGGVHPSAETEKWGQVIAVGAGRPRSPQEGPARSGAPPMRGGAQRGRSLWTHGGEPRGVGVRGGGFYVDRRSLQRTDRGGRHKQSETPDAEGR